MDDGEKVVVSPARLRYLANCLDDIGAECAAHGTHHGRLMEDAAPLWPGSAAEALRSFIDHCGERDRSINAAVHHIGARVWNHAAVMGQRDEDNAHHIAQVAD
ncbi:hypothetical protein ACAG24_023590 [Mycobacterium sp. pW049]|uniref:hypothetical protein n=1 Tax=[Mycobacterium] bulgaricum TaxID=3238985 RepID=UPI00351B6721